MVKFCNVTEGSTTVVIATGVDIESGVRGRSASSGIGNSPSALGGEFTQQNRDVSYNPKP